MPVLDSVLTCPRCGTRTRERMPENACQHFYRCPGCAALLTPHAGDCCVFCSYGTVRCPPMQAAAQNGPHDGTHGCRGPGTEPV